MIKQSPIRVAIGGGSTIDRAGLAVLLASFPDIEVLASDAHELSTVFVWDAGSNLSKLPDHPHQSFLLVLTNETDVAAFPPGVAGLFSKDESPEALAAAIRQVSRGQQYLSPSLALSILQHAGKYSLPSPFERENLTERERRSWISWHRG